jgi:hypothetical protein
MKCSAGGRTRRSTRRNKTSTRLRVKFRPANGEHGRVLTVPLIKTESNSGSPPWNSFPFLLALFDKEQAMDEA